MKAVIMAGGQGSRLRPLTENVPKPMARLCGRPVVEYILELLAENGVFESVLTLQYLPERITGHFEGQAFAGVKLSFCEEEAPLGTAGSVRNALGVADGPALVISGDALCDFPLRQAVEAHRESGAAVTIVTARVDDPREYGLVVADGEDRITGFVEKPSYAQATSELANTGIYILSAEAVNMIPDGRKFDFASDLFPEMLARGMLLKNCTLSGYWCDIGDLSAYRRAQADLLTGRVRCKLRGERDAAGNFFAGRRPAGRYELAAPVWIGEGVHIGDNVVVGAGSVLDDGCSVGAGARVEGGVLLPRCVLGERAQALGAVVCPGAAVKSKAKLLEGAAIGEGASVGAGAEIRAGVRVAGGAKVPDSAAVSDHLSAKGGAACAFDDEGMCGEVGVELTPELAVRVGCAVGTLAKGRPVGIATGDARYAKVLGAALIAGVRSTGAPVLDFGSVFEALFGFAMNYNALTLGVYLCAGEQNAIKVLCEAGLPATRRVEREIELALSRGEFSRAGADGFGDCMDMSGIGVMYLTELLRQAPDGLAGLRARVTCKNAAAGRLLSDVLAKLGCEVTEEAGLLLTLSEDGRRLELSEGKTTLSCHRAVAAWCLAQFEQQEDVAVENDFPRALDALAKEQGRRVYRYLLCPADGSDAQGRRLAARQQCARDGLMLAVQLLSYMRRRGLSLREIDGLLPPFAEAERVVQIGTPPARVLGQFSGEQAGEGIVVRGDRGVVLLRPRKNGSAIRVFAEAASWEIAQELCTDFSRRLEGLLDKKREKR